MQVRAWRDVPLKSTSARPPRLTTLTWTRYSSESSTRVAVDRVLALPLAVGDRLERQRHALGGRVADVVHRADAPRSTP